MANRSDTTGKKRRPTTSKVGEDTQRKKPRRAEAPAGREETPEGRGEAGRKRRRRPKSGKPQDGRRAQGQPRDEHPLGQSRRPTSSRHDEGAPAATASHPDALATTPKRRPKRAGGAEAASGRRPDASGRHPKAKVRGHRPDVSDRRPEARGRRPGNASDESARKPVAAKRRPGIAGSPKAGRRRATGKERRGKRRMSAEERARVKRVGSLRMAGVVGSGVVLVAGAIVGLLFFARPTTSEVERRTLTAFPEFSVDRFFDGSFFSDFALWYSDTYPLREQMVAADHAIEGLYGVKTDTQMVGGAKQADALPPVDADASPATSDEEDGKVAAVAERVERGSVEVPTAEAMAEAVQNQVLDGLYVKGDAAYNIYYFSQEAAQEYADMLSYLAETLDGTATVYSVIVPNASGVLLSDQEVKDLGGTNQVDAIKYFYSLCSDKVHDVDAVGKLRKHTDDYIYFRTDHHWTELGGYYGYEAFCEAKGIEPEDRASMKHVNFGDFLGSFYSQLKNADMAAHPDTVEAWIPNGTNDMQVWDANGNLTDYQVIADTSTWDIAGKNMAFIMGDQPLEHIHNPELDDGSSCLVIIDSYGCYFVPWLVDSYQDVWVADFRYFVGGYADLIQSNDIKDVIVLNNVSLAGGGVVAPAILGKW